jgi:hypothetical protein
MSTMENSEGVFGRDIWSKKGLTETFQMSRFIKAVL